MTKNRYRVLVLTDHRVHSAENSVYALLRTMQAADQCAGIDVVSRGIPENDAFFSSLITTNGLWGAVVESDFAYDDDGVYFKRGLRELVLTDYDIVFLRLPRPLSDDFLKWLPMVFPKSVMVNHPSGILETSTKAFLLNFSALCPPMKLCHTLEDVLDFAAQTDLVLKPLQEYGGRGLLKIQNKMVDDGENSYDLADYAPQLTEALADGGLLAMKFLKNVNQGDKRIIVVDGEIMAASLRLPPPDSWLCNVARGGVSVPTEITPEEENIIQTINPYLREAGVLIYGADTLVDDDGKRVLSEVNTLSIGGFPQAEAQTGRPIVSLTIDKLFKYADVQFAG